jgi:hypothetical protein
MNAGPWQMIDHAAVRVINGGDINNIADRIAFIEKTPRVRIRCYTIGEQKMFNDRGDTVRTDRQWPDFLNWCEGYKGDGADDALSRKWCDQMLVALGYTLS